MKPQHGKPSVTVRLSMTVVLATILSACSTGWVPEPGGQPTESYTRTEDGRYRVKRGDSLYAIAFNFRLDWRDVARWNGITSPYVIHPGQELRLTAPPRQATVTTRPAGPGPSVTDREAAPRATTRPSEPRAATPAPKPATTVESKAETVAGPDPSKWLWPVKGRILSRFRAGDPARNGIEIGGAAGQPVVATAGGEVVYSGNGLIGYGELIIIKHSERMLSAYAHNRKRLVNEGEKVSSGQKIAEMGRDDRNRALLHFEIRKNGTPQDPLAYLPKL